MRKLFSKLVKVGQRAKINDDQRRYRKALESAPTGEVLGQMALSAVPTTMKGGISTVVVGGTGAALTLTNILPLTVVLAAGIPLLLVSNVALQQEGELKELLKRARGSKKEEQEMDEMLGLTPSTCTQEPLSVSDLMKIAEQSD